MSSIPLQDRRGFTIVELLIVIVVIGILAAITLVAFNGVQTRTANTKTVSAAAAWAKAFHLYYTEHGAWPGTTRACLGSGYPSGFEGTGGTTECRHLSGDTQKSDLNTALAPYLGGALPSPDMTAIGVPTDWFRGILLYQSNVEVNGVSVPVPWFAVVQRDVTTCPDVAGLVKRGSVTHSGGWSCRYSVL